MENPFASREKGFGYLDTSTEQMDGLSFVSGVRNLISDDMVNSSSSELMNFDSFPTWCNSPSSATDILFTQYGLSTSQPMPFGAFTFSGLTRTFHDLESSYFGEERSSTQEEFHRSLDDDELSGKRRKVTNQKIGFPNVLNCTVPRSLSHSLDEKMLKALSLFMESSDSGEGILAQIWTPIKTGDQYLLSTCDQAYLLHPKLSQYREVSRKFTFATEANQRSFPGLPGRVFISGVPEWTSSVMYYKTDEYLRMKHAIDNEVHGSIAIPIFEASGTSCCAVMELVTSKEKPNFDTEMDSVCRALQVVNLRTSAIPRPQYFSSNQRDALAEIKDVLRAVCHAHKLPLALVWIPCSNYKRGKEQSVKVFGPNSGSGENDVLCIEETTCYVNDIEMEGFVHACLDHYLREKEGIVGKAFKSNQPFYSSDVKAYDISEYPLVQHARKYGLNAAVAIKLRSTYTGEDDYILELFLPVSMKGSLEQQLLLDSLSCTMQRICRTLRTVSEVGSTKKEVHPTCSENFQTISLDSEFNSTTSIFSGISFDKENISTISQGTSKQDMNKARTPEKKKSTTEKNVSLSVLQQHFSGSLKDAAKSLGVCPTTLKRICRQHGIMRWPSRKINKVNRSLRKIQTVLDSVQGVEGGLKFDSVTGEFIAIGSFVKNFDSQKGLSSHGNDAHLGSQEDADDTSFELHEVKFVDNAVKLEDDSTTNQAGFGSFMEVNVSGQPWAWMVEESDLNENEGLKSVCNLSSPPMADGMDKTIRCSGRIVEPNQSMSYSRSDSSNGSGAIMFGSSSTSMEDWNQTRTHNNNSGESGSTMLIVKATYREDTIRFKFDPSVGCPQLYKEVGKRFKLQDGSFQLKYLDDEEEWVMLVTDSDLQECLEILHGMGKHSVKFLVRDLPAPIGSSTGSNGYLRTGL
ncbi:Protein NLP8 [Cardamine amara subsp. amara]|uniref:Protein NLP8 n=1 Tax=Cardamine amara subsp. amara TaxID=228776 RepID=A0ABD0Z923_CARAN